MSAKVSVIMPACNVEKFLRECMDSIVGQTLKDIEIICVDDGSKDSTGAILDEYAAKCPAIRVIHKVNTGYGNSMNVGLDTASGEYIGILETDDFIEPDGFEKLYEAAKKYDADVLKANYYTYVSKPEPASTYFEVLKEFDKYDEVFCPEDFLPIFKVRASIWSGLYRRQFLVDNGIRFNETPGASFQDTGFAFKVWASARRAVLIREAYLHYRIDNSASSVKNMSKVFCICDEYDSVAAFLDAHPDKKARFAGIAAYNRYEQYRWNLDRLSPELKERFLDRMSRDMLREERAGNLDRSLFFDFQWERLRKIMHEPQVYRRQYREQVKDMKRIKVSVIIPVYNSEAFLDRCLTSITGQTLKEIEIITVNDGSKDRSLEILRAYEAKDKRIRVIDQPNTGAGAARNAGLRKAKGDYLAFLDSDDFYEPDMLEAAYRRAHETDADVCVFACDLFDNNTGQYRPCTWSFRRQYFPVGEVFKPQRYPHSGFVFQMFNGWPWDKLYKRSFIKKNGLKYQNLRFTNDMYFVFMALALSRRTVTVDRVLIHQRVDVSTSISRNRDKNWDCFYLGLQALQQGLMRRGLYGIFEQSFNNWALNFCLWQIGTMTGDAYENAFRRVKEAGVREFGLADKPDNWFYIWGDYRSLTKLMSMDSAEFFEYIHEPPAPPKKETKAEEKTEEPGKAEKPAAPAPPPVPEPVFVRAGRKVRLNWCIEDNGYVYTAKRIVKKAAKKLLRR